MKMENFIQFLIEHGAFYDCPRNEEGKRIGPLVGYAGTYRPFDRPSEYDPESMAFKTFEQPPPQHYVGEVYYNVAAVERWPGELRKLTNLLADMVYKQFHDHLPWKELSILAAPIGGLSPGNQLAENLGLSYGFSEKKVTQAAADGRREESMMVMNRHEIPPGTILLVEDVCNNFSTTAAIRDLITSVGAELVGIVCLVNRSPMSVWEGLPVISLAHIPTAEYRQDDPFVADDIAAGNVVWKPKEKERWADLVKLMGGLAAPNPLGFKPESTESDIALPWCPFE